MPKPKLFGADYSVYVRSVRLALHEKGIDYDLVPVDIFAESGPPPGYLDRQPFGRIPAFEHGDFLLYETGAITRYIDEAFPGPGLQPREPRQRARMNQIISIADGYVYPVLVWGIYVEQVAKAQRGETADDIRLSSSLLRAPICLKAIADLMGEAPWLGGGALSLADLHAAPMFDYFLMVPQGREMIGAYPNLASWWSRIRTRRSMIASAPARGGQ